MIIPLPRLPVGAAVGLQGGKTLRRQPIRSLKMRKGARSSARRNEWTFSSLAAPRVAPERVGSLGLFVLVVGPGCWPWLLALVVGLGRLTGAQASGVAMVAPRPARRIGAVLAGAGANPRAVPFQRGILSCFFQG